MKLVGISLAILIVVLALFVWYRFKDVPDGSFWNAVRNPDSGQSLEQFHKEVEESAQSLAGSPEQIAALVDYFVFDVENEGEAWAEQRVLAKLGTEAYPRALEILRVRSYQERLIALKEGRLGLPEAPINRLCMIFDLDVAPPEEAVALLKPYLQSESEEIRKSVALIVGSVASAESLPGLRRALRDEDGYVKSFALMGIDRAISGSRIGSSKDEIFTIVSSMWPEDTSFEVCDELPKILLQLDRERAIKFLQNDDLLSMRFSPLWRILEAFNQEEVLAPRERLLSFIEEASKEPIEYPLGNVVEQALQLLASHRNESDWPMLERFLDHRHEKVVRGATKAISIFKQVSESVRDPWKVVERDGWDSLTKAEKYICAIQRLDGEINNGGFAQYYFNPSGDQWRDAVSGLAAIGALQHLELMSATLGKFENSQPAADTDTRRQQLSKLVRKKEDPFSAQDKAWFKSDDENLERLIFKYNLANIEGREVESPTDEDRSR